MTTLRIREYAACAVISGVPVPVALEPAITDQTQITVSGSSQQSAAFNAQTRFILITTDGIVSLVFGANPTALQTTSIRLPADAVYFTGVVPGQKLAVISNT